MRAIRTTGCCLSLALLASVAASHGAQALPSIAVGSSYDITGSLQPLPVGVTTDKASGVDFLNFGAAGTAGGTIALTGTPTGSFATTLASSGCMAAASAGGCGKIVDLTQFSPFTPIATFDTVTNGNTTVSFDLTGLTSITRTPAGIGGSSAVLAVDGTGIIHANGYQNTAGTFDLVTNDGVGGTTFLATTTATNGSIASGGQGVPEPASMVVLGSGLLALGMVTRKRRA